MEGAGQVGERLAVLSLAEHSLDAHALIAPSAGLRPMPRPMSTVHTRRNVPPRSYIDHSACTRDVMSRRLPLLPIVDRWAEASADRPGMSAGRKAASGIALSPDAATVPCAVRGGCGGPLARPTGSTSRLADALLRLRLASASAAAALVLQPVHTFGMVRPRISPKARDRRRLLVPPVLPIRLRPGRQRGPTDDRDIVGDRRLRRAGARLCRVHDSDGDERRCRHGADAGDRQRHSRGRPGLSQPPIPHHRRRRVRDLSSPRGSCSVRSSPSDT